MCEFCIKHGEGEKWYLQAKNYSDDLMSDLKRRKFIKEFFEHPEELEKNRKQLERLDQAPGFVQRAIRWRVTSTHKKMHFGQVVPIEDIARIFDFVTSVVRVACICRYSSTHSEHRYCYGISMAPDGGQFYDVLRKIDAGYLTGPDPEGLETLSKEEALAAFRQHEKEGLCHSVWTFVSPFIGGICNCDRSDCLAIRTTMTHSTPLMFRAEYVAQADWDQCNGCRACMLICPFGAIGHSAAHMKATIDPKLCYGCGACRSMCKKNAIRLEDRWAVPEAARLW